MQQTQTFYTLPTQAIDYSFLDEFGTLCDAPYWLTAPATGADDWAAALPQALVAQTRKMHRLHTTEVLIDAYDQLRWLGFTHDDLGLACLNDEALLALAATQAATARAKDGYASYEPPGRPEHDRRFNMRRLRAQRAEVIINLESRLRLLGKEKWKAQYSGDESRRLRSEACQRTADWLSRGKVVIPIRDEAGKIIGEKIIPLIDAGSTRYKSYSEFVGFLYALQEHAVLEKRKWVMVTINAAAHAHPSSPNYDGITTPRMANRALSKMKKAAMDTLRKWHVQCAGASMKEPHKSAVPHNHIAMAHTARKIAEIRLELLLDTVFDVPERVEAGEKIPAYQFKLTLDDLTAESRVFDPIPRELRAEGWHMDDPRNLRVIPALTRDELIDSMARDIIECAFERHCIDLPRDDGTGRMVYGIGVNFKHFDDDGGAEAISYVMTYLLKSFAINIDSLPKREDFSSDEDYDKARKEIVRQQVEAGGDIATSAWAAAHGIRTRELFGLPSRSPWKALGKEHRQIKDWRLEALRRLVRNEEPQHAEYLHIQGGLNAPRKDATLRMRREKLASNYPLRPDMHRSRVLGVVRFGLGMWDRLAGRDKYSREHDLQPAAFHQTRIPGCIIIDGMSDDEKHLKLKRKSRISASAMMTQSPEDVRSQIDGTRTAVDSLQDCQRYKCYRRDGVGALVPNYPRGVQSTLDSGATAPPSEQKLLH